MFPKLADLLKNELFVVLEVGESFSKRVCSPCGTKVRNCAAMLSQIRENWTRYKLTMNNYCGWKKWVNPLIPIHFFVRNVANDFVENITWQFSDSVHRNLANGNCPWLGEVGMTNPRWTVRIFSVSPQSCSLFPALFQTFCFTAQAYLNTQKYGLFRSLK